jgi:hypothetical protein
MANWKFTRGTLSAHVVLDEERGTTLCGRTGLKFDDSDPAHFTDEYKCITCVKGLKK